MKSEIIIKSDLTTTQIAFIENQRLVEFTKEQNENYFSIGNIYLAKVKHIVSGLNAAFVNIGHKRDVTKEQNENYFSIGNIYLAKVKHIVSGLNAAFVNIGHKRDGFLHYNDLGGKFLAIQKMLHKALNRKNTNKNHENTINQNTKSLNKNGKIEGVLKTGDCILVQIIKEPISTKGAQLTTEISIAGRNIILIPFSNKVFLSQKIANEKEKARLLRLMKSIVPPNFGVIIRTLSQGRDAETLDKELKTLIKKWHLTLQKIKKNHIPKLLLNELDRTRTYLRDILNASVDNIYVNNKNTFFEIKDYLTSIAPEKTSILKQVNGKEDIFEKFNIHKQIKKNFGKIVNLKNGGYIVIEHPEAFHVIDVNSGQNLKAESQEENAFTVNSNACEEIAIQIRLRDMGGIILVDFIDMKNQANRKKLVRQMKECLKNDRAKHKVYVLTKLGLMQITRQRLRPETQIEVEESCPTCDGNGKISASILLVDEIESKINLIADTLPNKKIIIKAHPYLVAYLTKGLLTIRRNWQSKHKIKIKVEIGRASCRERVCMFV